VLRNLCRDFHLHFQVLWLTPVFALLFKIFAGKKGFSSGVLAKTARSLRFYSLETLPFFAPDGITDFGIALAKHCNLTFCPFVLRID